MRSAFKSFAFVVGMRCVADAEDFIEMRQLQLLILSVLQSPNLFRQVNEAVFAVDGTDLDQDHGMIEGVGRVESNEGDVDENHSNMPQRATTVP